MLEPKATHDHAPGGLEATLAFVKRTRDELRILRKVRLWKDRLRIIDVNKDCFGRRKGVRNLCLASEAIGQQPHRHVTGGLVEDFFERRVFAVAFGEGGEGIGAVENVIHPATGGSTQRSAHAKRLSERSGRVKKKGS